VALLRTVEQETALSSPRGTSIPVLRAQEINRTRSPSPRRCPETTRGSRSLPGTPIDSSRTLDGFLTGSQERGPAAREWQPASQIPSARAVALKPGATVQIAERTFDIISEVGEGSFGVVWGARCRADGKVPDERPRQPNAAIKEVFCHSKSDLAAAVNEGQILYALGGVCSGASSGRIPVFVACGNEHVGSYLGSEEWRVRLAMTFIPGESLNRYLHKRKVDAESVPERSCNQLLEQCKSKFAEACNYARGLISQLAPVFASISTIAYHRDVNPRNILVEDRNGSPHYGLIDFGLAVDAAYWRGSAQGATTEAVPGAWQVLGVGGDCRYWPVSAWLMLEQGSKALLARPQLCLEYKMHLDVHALGTTALEVFASLAPRPAEVEKDECLQKLWALCSAWQQYWEEATRFWRRLFDAYRQTSDQAVLAAVKVEYRNMAVHEKICEGLRKLRAALREACEACESASPDAGYDMAPPLLHALLAMISSGEDSARSSWRRVELLVERGDAGCDAHNGLEAQLSPRKMLQYDFHSAAIPSSGKHLAPTPSIPTTPTASPISASPGSPPPSGSY